MKLIELTKGLISSRIMNRDSEHVINQIKNELDPNRIWYSEYNKSVSMSFKKPYDESQILDRLSKLGYKVIDRRSDLSSLKISVWNRKSLYHDNMKLTELKRLIREQVREILNETTLQIKRKNEFNKLKREWNDIKKYIHSRGFDI